MGSDKDSEQDEMIRQNAERILRNEEAIKRQTEALEKIRDHYYPKKTIGKRVVEFGLKVVGAITICTGVMEATEWYFNEREISGMAEQSVAVAKRLMVQENDMVGAVSFLERAVELDGKNAKYRTMLGYMRGMAAVVEFLDLGRPLQPDEHARINEILSEAVFLQEAAPKDPMPFVLTAQAYTLRQEYALANQAIEKAIALAPENILVRCSGCAIRFFAKDFATAKKELAEAEKLRPDFPLVLHWKGMLAAAVDRDFAQARVHYEAMLRKAPRLALPHAMLGWALMSGSTPDFATARKEFEQALAINPQMKNVLLMMGETYAREGNLVVARLWCDQAIEIDSRFMKALRTRAKINAKLGEWHAASADLESAIALNPFSAELYRERADALDECDMKDEASADRKIAGALERKNEHSRN